MVMRVACGRWSTRRARRWRSRDAHAGGVREGRHARVRRGLEPGPQRTEDARARKKPWTRTTTSSPARASGTTAARSRGTSATSSAREAFGADELLERETGRPIMPRTKHEPCARRQFRSRLRAPVTERSAGNAPASASTSSWATEDIDILGPREQHRVRPLDSGRRARPLGGRSGWASRPTSGSAPSSSSYVTRLTTCVRPYAATRSRRERGYPA